MRFIALARDSSEALCINERELYLAQRLLGNRSCLNADRPSIALGKLSGLGSIRPSKPNLPTGHHSIAAGGFRERTTIPGHPTSRRTISLHPTKQDLLHKREADSRGGLWPEPPNDHMGRI